MPSCGGSRSKAAPSRVARRNMNFSSTELDDLVKASQLVPTAFKTSTDTVQKYSADSETLSTAVPSSAEQSPELARMESHLEAWPSLRQQGLMEWDFCSDDSDNEQLWEGLPEPAVPIEGTSEIEKSKTSADTWVLVPENGPTESETVNAPGSTQAEEAASKSELSATQTPDWVLPAYLLRERRSDDVLPPAAGAHMPAFRVRPRQRRNGECTAAPAIAEDRHTLDDSERSELYKAQRGWKNEHKATWNIKQQRRVTEQKARKLAQSCKSRGWLEDEESLQDEASGH